MTVDDLELEGVVDVALERGRGRSENRSGSRWRNALRVSSSMSSGGVSQLVEQPVLAGLLVQCCNALPSFLFGAVVVVEFGQAVGEELSPVRTNVTLYWLTGTTGPSANSYYETAHAGAWGASERSTVPTGVAVFPWMCRSGAPDLLVGDIREFFSKLR